MAYIRYRNGRFNQYRQMFILFFATEDCDAMTVSDNQNIAVPLAVVLAGGGEIRRTPNDARAIALCCQPGMKGGGIDHSHQRDDRNITTLRDAMLIDTNAFTFCAAIKFG